MSLKIRRHKEWLNKRIRRPKDDYPMATLAYYGPNDRLATKVVAALFLEEGGELQEMERWIGEDDIDIRHDDFVLEELVDWLKSTSIQRVVTIDRILGCPHEEGFDYPEGEVCPVCPFWSNRDRFTGEIIGPPILPVPEVQSEGGEPSSAAEGATERELIYSPLCQVLEQDGVSLQVSIYGFEAGQWTLEVVYGNGTSIVWDELFERDEDALATVLDTLREEGLSVFLDE